jgi:hypothetical protein
LQCQINMKVVFRISEDGSEIELKHCASSNSSVKSSRKYFVHLNWITLATNPCWDKVERRSGYPKMRVQIPLEPTNFSLLACSFRLIWK